MPASVVSIEKVRDSLPVYKRGDFDQGLIIIATASTFNSIDFLNPHRMNAAEIAESANMQMHGLTGDEVIQRADQILRERRSREREQAMRTLKRLEEKRANAASDQQQLARFTIDDARYYLSESPYGVLEPVIDIEVTNGTDKVISELLLRGVMTSSDRSAPWVDESFYYVVAGGIEPGEMLEWSLAPNRFGPWGNTQIPDDAELTVSLEGLRDVNQKPLWDSPELTEHETAKLERLQNEYGGAALSELE
ncbi:hypothetical protein QT230_15765 [Halomonas sp. SpR8]|nr:hypothetical protein [Halomonas sp. SpR8]